MKIVLKQNLGMVGTNVGPSSVCATKVPGKNRAEREGSQSKASVTKPARVNS